MSAFKTTVFLFLILFSYALTPAQAPAKSGAAAHLVLHLPLDETEGTVAHDQSRFKRRAVLQGGFSFEKSGAAGKLRRALRLHGRSNVLVVTGWKGILGAKPRTVCAWIKTQVGRGEICVWGRDEPGALWRFRIIRSGIWVDPKGGYLYTHEPVSDGKWHHVAAVVESARQPNLHDNVKLYQDGKVREIHDIGLLDLYPIDTQPGMEVRIGYRFQGLLDDLRIYDRALSPGEIEKLAGMKEK